MDTLVQAADAAVRPTAVVRATMPSAQIARWLPNAFDRVLGVIRRQRVVPSGPPFARYTGHGDLVEVEAGFPLDEPIDGDGDVVASGLPAGPAATLTHTDGALRLDGAYHQIEAWLDRHDFEIAGPPWEYYRRPAGGERDPWRWRVDIVVPYRWR